MQASIHSQKILKDAGALDGGLMASYRAFQIACAVHKRWDQAVREVYEQTAQCAIRQELSNGVTSLRAQIAAERMILAATPYADYCRIRAAAADWADHLARDIFQTPVMTSAGLSIKLRLLQKFLKPLASGYQDDMPDLPHCQSDAPTVFMDCVRRDADRLAHAEAP